MVEDAMFWMANAHGEIVIISPDWSELTGQTWAEAKGFGWLDAVHPDDRTIIAAVYAGAVMAHTGYSLRYRVQSKTGGYTWVVSGADASFGPPNCQFLGYLGAVVEIPGPVRNDMAAFGELSTTASPTAARMAALIAEAHGLATQVSAKGVREALELALTLANQHMRHERPGRPADAERPWMRLPLS
jgi:PAS domain S-box-containing protein